MKLMEEVIMGAEQMDKDDIQDYCERTATVLRRVMTDLL